MKVGVIGAGYWGKKHVDEYTQIGVDVTVSDLVDENLEICRKKYGARPLKDYKEMLSDKSIEAVSICTPNKTHYDVCKQCLEAGKNVLLEKPMTLEYSKSKELAEIASDKGLVLAVGHLYRFNNAVRKLKGLVEAGTFGDIYAVKMIWTNLEPVFPDRSIMLDLAIHPFDIIHYIFGKAPDNAFCLAGGFRQENEEMAFINSVVGSIMINFELSWITPDKIRDLVLVGSEKTAFVKLVAQKIRVRDNKTLEDNEVDVEESNTIRSELEDFLECIKTGRKPVADAEIGAEIVGIVEKMKRM